MVRKKPFTREEYEKGMQLPPFNYTGYALARAMESYDRGIEWSKTHPEKLPKDMVAVPFDGVCDEDISDGVEIMCECGNKFTVAYGPFGLCSDCGRAYKIIAYVAQYEKKIDSE